MQFFSENASVILLFFFSMFERRENSKRFEEVAILYSCNWRTFIQTFQTWREFGEKQEKVTNLNCIFIHFLPVYSLQTPIRHLK